MASANVNETALDLEMILIDDHTQDTQRQEIVTYTLLYNSLYTDKNFICRAFCTQGQASNASASYLHVTLLVLSDMC